MPRELATDLDMLERLVEPAGKEVVDVGCGGGGLVRELAARGAWMIGVEVSERQLAPALARSRDEAEYLIGRAEALPLPDASVDASVFMRTLHHVPSAQLEAALRESRRILRPGGAIYVAEPLAEGDFFALVSRVEDEREVRAAAQRALAHAGDAGLVRATTVEYEVVVEIPTLEVLRTRLVNVDADRGAVFDAHRDELGEAFAKLGEAAPSGARRFRQPMRADLLRPTAA